MPDQWEQLQTIVLDTLKDALRDLSESEEEPLKGFLQDTAKEYAREKWLSVAGPESERAEHAANLGHLEAQVVIRYAALKMKMAKTADAAVRATLRSVLLFLVKAGPGIFAGA